MTDRTTKRNFSKSQVKKLGSRIRRIFSTDAKETTRQEKEEVLTTLEIYRQEFSEPMEKVNSDLKKYLNEQNVEGEVTQRLKKSSTIREKLCSYESSMNLANMRDIAGCRIILNCRLSMLYKLVKYIKEREQDNCIGERDYINESRRSGYRAYHLFLKRDGKQVEVQLRTKVMHLWAETVEEVSRFVGLESIKTDQPSAYTPYFRELSNCSAEIEKLLDDEKHVIPSEYDSIEQFIVDKVDKIGTLLQKIGKMVDSQRKEESYERD